MATETTNYKLKKPGASDYYNIETHNDNMDIIDGLLKALADRKINVSDIVNNLTSADATKPLSAAQGAALRKRLDEISVSWKLLAEYATAGSYTFTVPDDVDELGVLVLGGGGSGGAVYGSDSYYAAATGGGSGQIVHEIMKKADGDFAAGEAIAVVVGAGGAAITASATLTNGKNGGSSSFGKITADGGNGGKGYKNTSNSASASASGGSGQSSDYASAYQATYSDNLTIDAPVGMVAYISNFDSDKNPIYISKRDVASARGAINIFDNTDTHIYCGAGASVTKWATEIDTNHYVQPVVSRAKGRAGTGKVSPTAAAVGGKATAPGDGGGAACGAVSGTKSGAGAAGLVLVYGRRAS